MNELPATYSARTIPVNYALSDTNYVSATERILNLIRNEDFGIYYYGYEESIVQLTKPSATPDQADIGPGSGQPRRVQPMSGKPRL